MGSYPSFDPVTGFTTTLVLRSRDEARLAAAEAAVAAMLAELKAEAGSRPEPRGHDR